MTRKRFLTFVGAAALTIGTLALLAPTTLLAEVKHAEATPAAVAMARTVGALLMSIGVLNLLIRAHDDSPTVRSVLLANLLLQVSIIPLDPLAWWLGAFHGVMSFAPNTALHLVLIAGFVRELRRGSASSLGSEGSARAPSPTHRPST